MSAMFSVLRLAGFFVPAYVGVVYDGKRMRHKKGGVDELKKLRNVVEQF